MTFLLAVCMAVSLLAVPAGAANTAAVTFSDLGDKSTAVAVESLRLLGVLDGYGDGTFRPGTVLTRAQFCKMAVYAMNGSNELGRYRTVTVFSDVKPSYWAAPYINMAAKGKNIISGYADGKFHPDRTVTVGQAVTILLRMLGYKDEDVGGVWPDSYMAEAALIGLTDGVSGTGNEGLTRGQAAKLFLNLLRADQKEGGSYLATLGETRTGQMLVSSTADGPRGAGTALQMASGAVYSLADGKVSNGMLNGTKGTLLLSKNGNEALTFVPDSVGSSKVVVLSTAKATELTDTTGTKYVMDNDTGVYYNGKESVWSEVYSWLNAGTSLTLYLDAGGGVDYVFVGGGGTTSNEAVIIYEKGSTSGFSSLAGGTSGYAIYKNGLPATAGDMRKYDVATYSSTTNSIRVCDTRITGYYEDCYPNPKEPTKITVLGYEFNVLPTAMQTVSQFKPGDQITLLLTEDNQVAGAVAAVSRHAPEVQEPEGEPLCHVVLWDFGAKKNIERELVKRGCKVTVVPSTATAEDILSLKPDGVMLSNGPGDPAENVEIIEQLRRLMEHKLPTFGICLGHQLLALSQGAKTEKLKYGHRGANQPAVQTATGRVYITSQNHGYAVIGDTLPEHARMSFINANDGTCEGVTYTDMPAFSVQFHPEACAGPLDTGFLFGAFIDSMKGADKVCR